jgi:hypothetical protein
MNSEFYNISLRGHVAFPVLCLKNAIEKFNQKNNSFDIVLNILWSLTSMKYVDEWLYKVSRIMPLSIFDDQYEDNNKISFSQYKNNI